MREATVLLISLMLAASSLIPAAAHAGILSDLWASFTGSAGTNGNAPAEKESPPSGNVQTMSLLHPALNIDPSPARGGGDVMIVDDTALVPAQGPSGTLADIERPKNTAISIYIVREGDTLSTIAKMFDVKPTTILWANDLKSSSKLQIGQRLVILPITGLKYTTKSGDTLQSIAKKFGGDADEIASYNGVSAPLAAGVDIIIPNGEASVPSPQPHAAGRGVSGRFGAEPAHNVGPRGTAGEISYYIAPLSHYTRTQGIHGYNAVDLGASVGTPILASADGDVIVAREGGWNGGYGDYVVLQHDNGSQTLYAHASGIIVGDGEHVVQGQVIGYVGATGKATGPHVHFEIRSGIRNPF